MYTTTDQPSPTWNALPPVVVRIFNVRVGRDEEEDVD